MLVDYPITRLPVVHYTLLVCFLYKRNAYITSCFPFLLSRVVLLRAFILALSLLEKGYGKNPVVI